MDTELTDTQERVAALEELAAHGDVIKTRNLWTYGDQSFTKTKTLTGVNIPAGEYVFSAEIHSIKQGKEAINWNSVARFYKGSTEVTYISLSRNCKTSVKLSLKEDVDRVVFFASNILSYSEGTDSEWKNIQLEKGAFASPYIPPYIHKDEAEKYENTSGDTLFELDEVDVPKKWRFIFQRQNIDPRNIIIDCEASYTGENANEYLRPKIFFYYSTGDQGSTKYYIGGKNETVKQSWRMPPIPNYTNAYANSVTIGIEIPTGMKLHIKHLTVRYDDKYTQNDDNSLKLDTHLAFMYYPEHTRLALETAANCGASTVITIPKMSSDGVWFGYHDDRFTISDTKLRNPNGSRITNKLYNGLRFYEIPFDYLHSLDWGAYKSNAFYGTKPMLISEMLEICAERNIRPMFSMHPYTVSEKQQYMNEAMSLRELAESYGVLNNLALKSDSAHFTDVLYPVFGDDINSYVRLASRSAHTDSDIQSIIDIFDNSPVDKEKVRCVIELWIDKATPKQVEMILNAGYAVSLANYTHVGPDGLTHNFIEADDYEYWQSLGVTEFTDSHNTSMGLAW